MSLGYVVKEGMAAFRRAPLATVTSITALMLAVLMLGILGRLAFNAYKVAQSLKQTISVEVFLKDIGDRQTHDLQSTLQKEGPVDHVTYISKDSAAAVFRRDFGSGGAGLANLGFLPASFRLHIKEDATPDQISSMVSNIKKMEGVEAVQFNRYLLELLQKRIHTLVLAGSGIGVIILLVSVLLVFNTIRLTIYAKRGLIKAMKLVGATNGFVRRPFLVEGIIQGIIAGIISTGLVWLFFQYAVPVLIPQFGILSWPYGEWYYQAGAMLLLAIILGFWGSRLAARKFIKDTSLN
jgi:cell division transport system permease protein